MSADTPKMVREALCAAQSGLGELARRGLDVDRVPVWIDQIGSLIRAVDTVRPLGSNGKHGDLHTHNCGCEGHRGLWSILLDASPRPLPGGEEK